MFSFFLRDCKRDFMLNYIYLCIRHFKLNFYLPFYSKGKGAITIFLIFFLILFWLVYVILSWNGLQNRDDCTILTSPVLKKEQFYILEFKKKVFKNGKNVLKERNLFVAIWCSWVEREFLRVLVWEKAGKYKRRRGWRYVYHRIIY